MKIALLGPYPVQLDPSADGPALPGGVDAVVLALATGLSRCPGVDVHVVSAVPDLAGPRIYRENGYTVHALPRPRRGRLTGQRQVVAGIKAALAHLQPDMVHAHIAGIHARAAIDSPFLAVVTLHGIIRREMEQAWPNVPWSTRLRWLADTRFEEHVVRDATELISISPYVLAELRGQTAARFHTVENPVADHFFGTQPAPGRERLLSVARVIPRKGTITLIEAFGQIAHARPQATLTLVGETHSDPGYAARCRTLAEALGIAERVRFVGALPPEVLVQQYAGCDLFVLASEQETAPVSIAEAMASSRPVLTTDVGGCADMVTNGVTGTVTPPRNPNAFAAAAIDLLSRPARMAQMGLAAHIAAKARFQLDAVVAKTLAVYELVRESHSMERSMADNRRTAR